MDNDFQKADFQQLSWDARLEDDWLALVHLAIREDLSGLQDQTSASLIPARLPGQAAIVARQPGVIAGLPAAQIALREISAELRWSPHLSDGDPVKPGDEVATISGPAKELLTAERLVLNTIGRLSGIASLTRQYVEAVAGAGAKIYDTRKTTPGWRRLEKYAVRMGGGANHRTGLFDAVLIKDNHLALRQSSGAGASFPAAEAVRAAQAFVANEAGVNASTRMLVEVEVDTLEQLAEVLPARPDIVLLDNMPPETLRRAVAMRDAGYRDVQLEASGGIGLANVRAIALTGVQRISIGALTHSAAWLDVGLDWRPAG